MRAMFARLFRPYAVIAEQNRVYDELWAEIERLSDTVRDVSFIVSQVGFDDGDESLVERARSLAGYAGMAEKQIAADFNKLRATQKQADAFAADNVAKAEEIVRLHSEAASMKISRDGYAAMRDEAIRGRDQAKADLAAAVKAEANVNGVLFRDICDSHERMIAHLQGELVRKNKALSSLRDRLAAIKDAANQPIDCDSAKPERVGISLALSGGCVKCPTPGCRWTFYGSNCPGCGIRHPGIAVPDAANKPID